MNYLEFLNTLHDSCLYFGSITSAVLLLSNWNAAGRAMDWGDRWRACGGCHRVEETICWSFIVIIIFFIYIHSDSRRLRIGFVFIVIISIVVLYIQTLGG